jgi:hypothetical protein
MRRSSSTIPFGYKLNDEDTTTLEPVEKELEALNEVVPLIQDKSLSLREGSLYISHLTGRSLSHQGLKKIAEKRSVG